MAVEDHLSIALVTQLEDTTGEPSVMFKLAKIDRDREEVDEVGHVIFTPGDAHLFAIKLMHAALDVEFFSASVMAMRAHKISEEGINEILAEIDVFRRARRDRE